MLHEDGRADAVHVERADVEYPSLAALCEAYGLDEDEVRALVKPVSALRRWVLHEDSGATETIEAATLAEAVERLREWIAGGEYEITSTVWTDGWVHAEDDPDERESVTVAIDPDEPDCVDGHTHDWHEVSVHGHGGGVISTDECRHCLARRTTDTWAQHPSTGEQGLHAVSYEAGHMICCTGCGDEISHDEAHWHGGEHYCQGCEAAPRED